MPNAKVVRPNFKNPDRSPNGIGTSYKEDIKSKYGLPDPTAWTTYFDDFIQTAAFDYAGAGSGYTKTVVGTGTTLATAVDGGNVAIVTTAAGSDATTLARASNFHSWAANRSMIMEARFSVDDATNAHAGIGLIPVASTPFSYVDGFAIRKPAAGTTFTIEVKKSGQTTYSLASAFGGAVCPANTLITAGLAYRGFTQVIGGVTFYKILFQLDLNDGNGPRRSRLYVPSTSMPTALLTPQAGVLAGTAVARTMNLDYLFSTKER